MDTRLIATTRAGPPAAEAALAALIDADNKSVRVTTATVFRASICIKLFFIASPLQSPCLVSVGPGTGRVGRLRVVP